jgi:FkbM family methyltransferase
VRKLVKSTLQRSAGALGFRLYRATSVPFGVDWLADVRHFPEGRRVRVAIDVGANVGQTALALGTVFPEADVYSFEPIESTFEALRRALAGHPHLCPFQLAVAEAPGELHMTAVPGEGRNRIVSAEGATAVETVKATSVDEFCREHSLHHVDILKIDVEGAEMGVLRGATATLSSCDVPFILLECEFQERPDEPHALFDEVREFLKPSGYRVLAFYSGGVDNLGWRWGNVLFRRSLSAESGPVAVSPFTLRD